MRLGARVLVDEPPSRLGHSDPARARRAVVLRAERRLSSRPGVIVEYDDTGEQEWVRTYRVRELGHG